MERGEPYGFFSINIICACVCAHVYGGAYMNINQGRQGNAFKLGSAGILCDINNGNEGKNIVFMSTQQWQNILFLNPVPFQ